MSASRVAARLARALGFTPSQDQVASALLGVPPAQARAELDSLREQHARRVRQAELEAEEAAARQVEAVRLKQRQLEA